jgi:hypothetical protein
LIPQDTQIPFTIVVAVRRRRVLVPAVLALAGFGWAAAHAFAHETAMGEGRTLSNALNGYVGYMTTSFALCLALALPLAAGAMVGKRWHGSSLRSLWLFGLVPVLGFAGHALAEPLTGASGRGWSSSELASIVLVGLAVQIPFALVAVGLARHVLWLAESLARALVPTSRVQAARARDRYPLPHDQRVPRERTALAHRQRGPPLLAA